MFHSVLNLTELNCIALHCIALSVAALGNEARACYVAGARWLHIDVCDSGSQCKGSLTVGPGTVLYK